jgi:hypothetical protein
MAGKKGTNTPKDVGAAKGMAGPGSDNSAADGNMKDKQMKGGKKEPIKAGPSATPSDNSLSGRGCSSSEAAAAYKKAGLKVPTSQSGGWS